MPQPSPHQLLERFCQAMLDFSTDALADLFSADAVYEFPFLSPQRQRQRYDGREEIRAGFARAWGSYPDSPVNDVREVRVHETANPEVIVAEYELDAVDPRTGSEFSSAFVLVLRIRDGRIVHLRDYTDVLAVATGLGTLPALVDSLRDQPPAYALSEVRARDGEALDRYRETAAESIAAHGGRYLVRGGPVHPAEGDWAADRMVVLVEFPSSERLQRWYSSPEYAPALSERDVALERRLLFLEGTPR